MAQGLQHPQPWDKTTAVVRLLMGVYGTAMCTGGKGGSEVHSVRVRRLVPQPQAPELSPPPSDAAAGRRGGVRALGAKILAKEGPGPGMAQGRVGTAAEPDGRRR